MKQFRFGNYFIFNNIMNAFLKIHVVVDYSWINDYVRIFTNNFGFIYLCDKKYRKKFYYEQNNKVTSDLNPSKNSPLSQRRFYDWEHF